MIAGDGPAADRAGRAAARAGGRARGAAAVVLISGEAGIGKTRLVAEVEATARGVRVLHGECVEFGGEELASGRWSRRCAAPPTGWRNSADGLAACCRARRRALAAGPAVRAAARRRLARRAPVLLVLEDVHWADRATLALLAFLARNLRDERIAVLATYRVDDALSPGAAPARGRARAAPDGAADRAGAARGPTTSPAQLEALAGAPVPAALAADLHARAGGNPFFVEELFAAATRPRSKRRCWRGSSGWTRRDAARAGGVRAGTRATRCSSGSRSHPDALRAALDAGVLVPEPDGLAFRHGLIGEVVYERLLPAERRALHRRIAAALHDAPAALRAHQCHRAGLREEALAASMEAGPRGRGRARLARPRCRTSSARWSSGRARDASTCSPAPPRPRASAAPRSAPSRCCREAIALDRGARAASAALRAPRRVPLLGRRGRAGLLRARAGAAAGRAAAAGGEGPRADGPAALGRVARVLRGGAGARAPGRGSRSGSCSRTSARPSAGEAYLREALELAGGGEETARAYMHLGEVRRVRGDHAGALAAMVDGERAAARLGLRGSFGHFMYVNARRRPAAARALGRGRRAAGRRPRGWTSRAPRPRCAARSRASCTRCAGTSRRRAPSSTRRADDGLPSEFLAPLAAARATLALAEGDAARGRARTSTARSAGVQDPLYTPPLYSLALRAEADAERDADAAGRRFDGAARGLDASARPRRRAGAPGAGRRRARPLDATRAERWPRPRRRSTGWPSPIPAAYARWREAEARLLAGGDRAAALRRSRPRTSARRGSGARPLLDEVEALARRARLRLDAAAPPGRPPTRRRRADRARDSRCCSCSPTG